MGDVSYWEDVVDVGDARTGSGPLLVTARGRFVEHHCPTPPAFVLFCAPRERWVLLFHFNECHK